MWQVPDEPSIYPYTCQKTVPARSLIVFAPHPDDEVFGCGGLLAACLQAGIRVQVVLVTSGDQGGDAPARERESTAAAFALARGNAPAVPQFWRLPDRGVLPDAALVQRMRAAIVDSGADWVLCTSPYEIHPDHRAVSLAATQAFADTLGAQPDARLAWYEVGHPLFANLLIDITDVVDRKRAAIHCFPSQLAVQDYGDQLLALNRFRSYTLGPGVSHAEAYQVLDSTQLQAGVEAALHAQTDRLAHRLGLRA